NTIRADSPLTDYFGNAETDRARARSVFFTGVEWKKRITARHVMRTGNQHHVIWNRAVGECVDSRPSIGYLLSAPVSSGPPEGGTTCFRRKLKYVVPPLGGSVRTGGRGRIVVS